MLVASLPRPFGHVLNICNGSTFQDPVHYPSLADKYESAVEELPSRRHWSTFKYQVSGFFFLIQRAWDLTPTPGHSQSSLSDSQ